MDQVPTVPASTPTNTLATGEAVPSGNWPGAFGVYDPSKKAVKFNLGTILKLVVLSILVGIAAGLATPYRYSAEVSTTTSPVGTVVYILCELVAVLLSAGMVYAVIAGVKREQISLSESLKAGWEKFFPYLVQSLLIGLIVAASLLLFIIPFFFIMPRLTLAPYYLLEGKLGIIESIKASWEATKGNVGKVWGIIGVNLLIGLLAATIIGIPFAIYFGFMYMAADVILYFWIKKHHTVQIASPIVEQK